MRFQRIIRVCAVAGLLGISLLVLAQEEPADTATPAALFEKLDADKDGKLTREEVGEERARFFDRLVRVGDKNEDGALTKEEFIAGSQPAERPAQPDNDADRRTQFRAQFMESIFKRSDSNGDGKLTLDEAPDRYKTAVRSVLNRLGKGLNGAVTLEEFVRGYDPPAPRPPFGGRSYFSTLDANRDGKLSKEELSKAVEQFDKLDRDGDGQLDTRELSGVGGVDDPNANPVPRPGMDRFVNGFIERYDADKDGKISAKELADLPERSQERIKNWDGNKDGEVTKDEVTEALRRLNSATPDSEARREGRDRGRQRPSRPESDD